jgi:hypothetical protein
MIDINSDIWHLHLYSSENIIDFRIDNPFGR